MKRKWLPSHRSMFVGLLGSTMLIGTAAFADPVKEKWWTPREGRTVDRERPRVERIQRPFERIQGERRFVRQWRGHRIYRDHVVIRDGHRYRGWRYAIRPVYHRHRHIVNVRPVWYFATGRFDIGGVHVSARLGPRDRSYLGCNFCDARFDGYRSYRRHVVRCADRPYGYRVVVSSWDWDRLDDDWYEDHSWHPREGWDEYDD